MRRPRRAILTMILVPALAVPALAAEDDLPGKVVHSWLGNSFAKEEGRQSVPVNVCGIAVTPDGTVFSAGVAEAGGGVGSYKAGKFVTRYDYESGFGSSASAVAADETYVYIGTGAGLFRTRRGDESYNRTPAAEGDIQGLALHRGELYMSDAKSGKIRVLDTATMKELRSFAATTPGPIAVEENGRVWCIQGKPAAEPYLAFYTGGARVVSFSPEGQPGPEVADFENPCSLAIDPKGRLLIGGLNRDGRIAIYSVSGKPERVETFGAEGGIFSGEPGRYAPKKFHWVRGLGFDAAGNLYVASVLGSWYNVTVEAYSPSGDRLWDVHGLGNWLDTACLDPGDETLAYTKENVYRMDWSRPPGQEASPLGLSLDRFRYPRDNRVHEGHGPSHRLVNGVRRIGGKPFLFCGSQGTGSLEIFKHRRGEGFVAAPCGYVGGASIWRPEAGKRWPEDAEAFLWSDTNGDGAPNSEEFTSVERAPRWGSMHLDDHAGIWQISGDSIFHLPCEGLDANGNPIYRRASEVVARNPPEFPEGRLRRLFYVPKDDVLITGGSPGTDENACNLLIAFDRGSDPSRRVRRWSINLPLDDKTYTPETGYGGGAPQALSARGEYVFIAYGYGLIRVHRLDDGRYVGTIRPDIQGFKGGGGCVDSDNALNVSLRTNGEYVLFLENAGRNHVMLFRWTPARP